MRDVFDLLQSRSRRRWTSARGLCSSLKQCRTTTPTYRRLMDSYRCCFGKAVEAFSACDRRLTSLASSHSRIETPSAGSPGGNIADCTYMRGRYQARLSSKGRSHAASLAVSHQLLLADRLSRHFPSPRSGPMLQSQPPHRERDQTADAYHARSISSFVRRSYLR